MVIRCEFMVSPWCFLISKTDNGAGPRVCIVEPKKCITSEVKAQNCCNQVVSHDILNF